MFLITLSVQSIPFDDFQIELLWMLNVAPTQLYPNTWMAIQAFQIVYKACSLTLNLALFFHHFHTRMNLRLGWLSLISEFNKWFFQLFVASYNNFKDGHFKVAIKIEGHKYLFDEDDYPKFPLYCSRNLKQLTFWYDTLMMPEEQSTLKVLEELFCL